MPELPASRSLRPFPVARTVLVVGGAGYIGSVLSRRLLASGYRVRVYDAQFYGAESLAEIMDHPGFELVAGDTRDVGRMEQALSGVDAIAHLGELVGDPACNLDAMTTLAINRDATISLGQMARQAGIRRFVYPSSCSVYGSSDEVVTEESALNPLSLYARAKIAVENDLLGMSGAEFEPVIFRLATVYGLSDRPRFDLIVNLLAARSIVEGEVEVHGGRQWRPFVHVVDVARAFEIAITAPAPIVGGRIFNIGSDEQNHTIGAVADLVCEVRPSTRLRIEPVIDPRNYRVSFRRVRAELGFEPSIDLRDAIIEIQAAVADGVVGNYLLDRYSNVRALAALNGQLHRTFAGGEVFPDGDLMEGKQAARA